MCRACASPGGGCQFLGTAATSQVVGEALGMCAAALRAGAFRASHLARYGAAFGARRDGAGSARTAHARHPHRRQRAQRHGGARGLRRLHQPDPAPAGDRASPPDSRGPPWTIGRASTARCRAWWTRCPTVRKGHPTVQVFLAGGVPEVMLHLRRAGLLETGALTASGETLGAMLDWWEQSERRAALRARPARARRRRSRRRDHGAGRRARARPHFHRDLSRRQPGAGRLGDQEHRDRPQRGRRRTASTARRGPARVFRTEHDAVAAIKDGAHPGGRRAGADVPRADGLGHGGDLPDHFGAASTWHSASMWR